MSHVARAQTRRSAVAVCLVAILTLTCLASLTPVMGRRKSPPSPAPPNPSVVGQWEPSFSSAPLIHASVLPNGKVLHWTQFQFPPTYSRLWGCVLNNGLCEPDVNGTHSEDVWYNGTDLFCSGHTFLPDGRLFVAGGTIYPLVDEGTPATTIFNLNPSPASPPPAVGGPQMTNGRWYPSAVSLANGETAILSGTYCAKGQAPNCEEYRYNNIPEVLSSNGATLRSLTNAELQLPNYPWLHLATDGRVFYSGPNSPARWLNTSGAGAWGATVKPYYYSQAPHFISNRDSGSSVMYDVNKVLIAGGGVTPPTNTAETIDLTNETGNWTPTGSMQYARRHLNLTILADGQVLATGGTQGSGFNDTCIYNAIFPAELWNPATGAWTTLASATKRRQYHSTAILLPDARVLIGGSTDAAATSPNCKGMDVEYQTEIFTPPYLFNSNGTYATRPTISYAPDSVSYGNQFLVLGPNTVSVAKVTMVRLSSVTHSINMNQRINHLTFSRVGMGLRVNAPASSSMAPPGHYMLFLINNAGVPSVAKIIQIQ
jgi:hypothetical protein